MNIFSVTKILTDITDYIKLGNIFMHIYYSDDARGSPNGDGGMQEDRQEGEKEDRTV